MNPLPAYKIPEVGIKGYRVTFVILQEPGSSTYGETTTESPANRCGSTHIVMSIGWLNYRQAKTVVYFRDAV